MENNQDSMSRERLWANIKSHLARPVVLGLSLIFVLHFSVSLLIWFLYVRHVSTSDAEVNWPYLLHCVPALILFSISLAAFILALLKKHKAGLLLLIALVLSVSCFIYETHYDKWCYTVSPIALDGVEPYQGLGFRYIFVNWWWYEKDIVRSGNFSTDKVFHHFFGIRPKGYRRVIFVPLPDANDVRDTVEE